MEYRIDRSEVLRSLGHSGQEMTDELAARIDSVIARCERELRPSFVLAFFDVDEDASSETAVALRGTPLVLPGRDFTFHVRGARMCALIACTLGAKSEQLLRQLAATNPLDALVCDAACSALVEQGCDAAEAEVVAEAHRRGLHTGARFSPGYGDLPLSVQPQLLATLDAYRRLGLTTTETNMLLPTKSVTALVGLFDAPSQDALADDAEFASGEVAVADARLAAGAGSVVDAANEPSNTGAPAAELAYTKGGVEHRRCASCRMRAYCNLRRSGKVCYG